MKKLAITAIISLLLLSSCTVLWEPSPAGRRPPARRRPGDDISRFEPGRRPGGGGPGHDEPGFAPDAPPPGRR